MSDEAGKMMNSTNNSKPKPHYQPPKVIHLNPIIKGHGANCGTGAGAKGHCSSGTGANANQ